MLTTRTLATSVLVWCAATLLCSQAFAQGIEAISKPSGDVRQAFVRPGIIDKILVEPGAHVKAGDLLVQQDDKAELAQLKQLHANAKDTIRIRASQKKVAQSRTELKKLEQGLKKHASTALEVERAALEVEIGDLSVELETFDRGLDQMKAEETQLQIDRMKLISKLTGVVEEVYVKEGEAADGMAKIIRVVCIDPLWVDVPAPMKQADGLASGDEVEVVFDAAPGTPPAKGKVKYVAAVAEPSSYTRMIRVEVPNPTNRPAGEHVRVILPAAKVAAQVQSNRIAQTQDQ